MVVRILILICFYLYIICVVVGFLTYLFVPSDMKFLAFDCVKGAFTIIILVLIIFVTIFLLHCRFYFKKNCVLITSYLNKCLSINLFFLFTSFYYFIICANVCNEAVNLIDFAIVFFLCSLFICISINCKLYHKMFVLLMNVFFLFPPLFLFSSFYISLESP